MENNTPYSPLAKGKVRTLTQRDFVAAVQILGTMSKIASYEVAQGHATVVPPQKPMQMYLYAQYEAAIATDANLVLDVDLGAQSIKMAQSTRSSSAFPATDNLDVRAEISANGGTTWTTVEVNSANFTTNVVNIDKLANTNRIRITYLPADGEMELAAEVPQASGASRAVIFSSPLRELFEADQTNIKTGTKTGNIKHAFLPAEFLLTVRVRSNSKIVWGFTDTTLALAVIDAPIQVHDKPALWRMAENELKGIAG